MHSDFITTKQAADFLGLRANTMEIWRLRGTGPRFVKLGRAVRYRLSDLEDYISAQTQTRTKTRTEDHKPLVSSLRA